MLAMDLFEVIGAALLLQAEIELYVLGCDLSEVLKPAALPTLEDILGQQLSWRLLLRKSPEAFRFLAERLLDSVLLGVLALHLEEIGAGLYICECDGVGVGYGVFEVALMMHSIKYTLFINIIIGSYMLYHSCYF